MDTNQIKQNLLKLKDSFLEETEENKKMLDIYINYIAVSYTHLTLPTTMWV